MSLSLSQSKEKKNPELLYVAFNQDHGCFACGTETGFCVFNSDPLKERFRRDFENGGIGIVEMLFRCNILALVGGGANPKFPPNKVMIWDDYQNKCIAELDFRREVKAVKLRRDRIVVVLENKVYVYNFADLQLLHQIETYSNPRGLVALSPSSNTVLAAPGLKAGSVRVELYDSKQTQTIQAHATALTQICLSADGTRLATASEKGTLIRLFDTNTGVQLRELRRGADKAEIYSISFSPDGAWLATSSDKGTAHIYGIGDLNGPIPAEVKKAKDDQKNRQSSFAFMKDILPSYFSSEWSFASFHIQESHSIVCFSSDGYSIIVLCANGMYYKYAFDPMKGGECKQEAAENFGKQLLQS